MSVEPVGPALVELVRGVLKVHGLGVGSAHLAFTSASELLVQPFAAEPSRFVRTSGHGPKGPWRVKAGGLSFELPDGMAVLDGKPGEVPLEVRFCAGTLPAARIVLIGASAPKQLGLADGSRFTMGVDRMHFLPKSELDAAGFAQALVKQGKQLMREGMLGDVPTVEVAAGGVRERWYLGPVAPLVLVGETRTFDVSGPLADRVAASVLAAV